MCCRDWMPKKWDLNVLSLSFIRDKLFVMKAYQN
jgi:hypothetical protein